MATASMTGMGGLKRVSSVTVNNAVIGVPSQKEQQKIVSFLNTKCAEIEVLTADIQSQINTLEQYKRSVITEEVTKGLNPDVEMWGSTKAGS